MAGAHHEVARSARAEQDRCGRPAPPEAALIFPSVRGWQKLRARRAPVLAVGDGALGFWGALREVFPQTREQRCWFHYADLRIMPRLSGDHLQDNGFGLGKSA